MLQDQWGDVAFFLLPYLRPSVVNDCLGTGCKSFQEAAEAVLEGLPERKGRRVLVAHQFVAAAGQPPELSDSEMPLSVGGTELVDAALFQGFDYVALGHLHRCLLYTSVLKKAGQAFGGERCSRIFMYNPDAIAMWFYEKHRKLFRCV